MSLAAIRYLLTNTVSIESPVEGTNGTHSSLPSLASKIRRRGSIRRREHTLNSNDIVIGIKNFSQIISGITVKTVSIGSIVTLAEVGDRLTNTIGIEVPVGGTSLADVGVPGLASGVSGTGSRGELAGDVDDVVVGIEDLSEGVAAVAGRAPTVGEVVGLALVVNRDTDSVGTEDPVLRTSLTDVSVPGVAALVGGFLEGSGGADSVGEVETAVAGGAESVGFVGGTEGRDLSAYTVSVEEPPVGALTAGLSVPVPGLAAEHAGTLGV